MIICMPLLEALRKVTNEDRILNPFTLSMKLSRIIESVSKRESFIKLTTIKFMANWNFLVRVLEKKGFEFKWRS